MKVIEPTLKERTGQLYRRLLLLQHLFQVASDAEDADWLDKGDKQQNLALVAGIREMLDELTEHARVMTSIPMPISEWRPGDGPGDERWRPLTELERREVLALLAAYESLVSWSEQIAGPNGSQPLDDPRERRNAHDYLRAERAKIERFRQEMAFLEKRPREVPPQESSAQLLDRPHARPGLASSR